MLRVKIAELRNHLSKYLHAVQEGEEIEVTDRDRVIAKIVPAQAQAKLTIIPATKPWAEVRDKVYEPANWGFDVVDWLIEDRRRR